MRLLQKRNTASSGICSAIRARHARHAAATSRDDVRRASVSATRPGVKAFGYRYAPTPRRVRRYPLSGWSWLMAITNCGTPAANPWATVPMPP